MDRFETKMMLKLARLVNKLSDQKQRAEAKNEDTYAVAALGGKLRAIKELSDWMLSTVDWEEILGKEAAQSLQMMAKDIPSDDASETLAEFQKDPERPFIYMVSYRYGETMLDGGFGYCFSSRKTPLSDAAEIVDMAHGIGEINHEGATVNILNIQRLEQPVAPELEVGSV